MKKNTHPANDPAYANITVLDLLPDLTEGDLHEVKCVCDALLNLHRIYPFELKITSI